MSRLLAGLVALSVACADPGSIETSPGADLVLTGGSIVTLASPGQRAEAVAVTDGRIVAVGSADEVADQIGASTQVVDLAGRTVVPGLIEGHGHFVGLGSALRQVAAGEPKTWEGVVSLVADAAAEAPAGSWIEGRGWHQDKWDETPEPNVEGYPVHDGLSAASPDHPVVLRHASGHAAFANARAMELAGIDSETPDPPGGRIVRDADGRPTGVFIETAQGLVARRDDPSSEEIRLRLEAADQHALRYGITSFQDAGSDVDEIEAMRSAVADGAVDIRLWVMIREDQETLASVLPDIVVTGAHDYHFTVGGIKHSIDGALGSRGAWLLEPYSDQPETTGLQTTPTPTIEASAELAKEHDLQLCVHAIGDRANQETLDLFAAAMAADPDGRERRWRVEHAQNLHPDDVPRFAELGVIASIQSVHCTSDGPWVPDRLGEERARERAYVWRHLVESGARLMNGTDTPVEPIDPFANYYSAVTRRMANGEAFTPEHALAREEALRTMTIDAAYGAFEEDLKGTIEVGKLADLVVLSQDILMVEAEQIPGTEVEVTVLGGEIVYERP